MIKINSGKAIGIVGTFGMAAIWGEVPGYIVAMVASLCILVMEEEKKEDPELTITKSEKK